MTLDTFLSGLLGGGFALLIYSLGQLVQTKRLRRSMLEALLSEAKANELIAQKSIETNSTLIQQLPPDQRSNNDITIDDETKVYVTPHVDIALQTWVNQNVGHFLKHFNTSALIDYKLKLMRVNYLIERNRGFRYRFHFLDAMVVAQRELLIEIRKLKEALSHSGLTQ